MKTFGKSWAVLAGGRFSRDATPGRKHVEPNAASHERATPHAPHASIGYRSEIDGLRAVAVLPVVVYHAGFHWMPSGFFGVDIFFVISGYLITSLVLEDVARGRFSLRSFYERRARRILPALFVVLAATFPVAFALMYPDQFKLFGASAFTAILFSSNLFFYETINYFDHDTNLYPLIHTWSLGVEEQFYIFIPLLIMWTFGRSPRATIALLIALMFLSFISAQIGGNFSITPPFVAADWSLSRPPSWNFYLLPSRAWELLLGSMAALRWRAHGSADGIRPVTTGTQVAAIAGLFLVGGSFLIPEGVLPTPGILTLVPTVGTALLILFAIKGTLSQKLLSSRALVAIGLASYSLYLWHQPIFALARIARFQPLGTLDRIGLVAIASLLAFLSLRFVERPFRDRRRTSTRTIWSLAAAGSATFLVAGGLSYALPANILYGARLQATQEGLLETAIPRDESRACHTGGTPYRKAKDACIYFNRNATIAVFGDSHGVELSGALADRLQPLGEAVQQFTYSGAIPSFGQKSVGDPIAAWTKEAASEIAANPGIKDVVVVYRMNYYLERPMYDRKKVLASYLATIEFFLKVGKRVVVVLPPPEMEIDIRKLMLRAPTSGALPSESRERWEQRMADLKRQLAPLANRVGIVDPAKLFCDEDRCRASEGAVALYMDDNHTSAIGARRIADAVLAALGR